MKLHVGFAAGLPSTEVTFADGFLLSRTASALATPEDPCEEYATGLVGPLIGGLGWAADGSAQAGEVEIIVAEDPIDYLVDGNVVTGDLVGGSGWANNGTIL